jgi:hypothetical protein
MMKITCAMLVGCSLLAFGCSKKDEGGAAGASSSSAAALKGTCDEISKVGKCREFMGEAATTYKSTCNGTWGTDPCPTPKSFGNCTASDRKLFYYPGKIEGALEMTEDFAKLDCEMISGKYVATAPAAPTATATAAAPASAPAVKAATPASKTPPKKK